MHTCQNTFAGVLLAAEERKPGPCTLKINREAKLALRQLQKQDIWFHWPGFPHFNIQLFET